jgi:hypothetical protein
MKKFVLIIVILILLILSLVTRNFAEIGIKNGINITDLHISIRIPYLKFQPGWTWLFGVFYAFNLSKNAALQPEIFYTQKGGISKETFSGESITTNHKLSYIELPVLLKFKIPLESPTQPVFLLGPYAAYRLSAKAVQTAFGGRENINLEKYTKKWDLGLILGAGLEFNFKKIRLLLETRYSFGFTNIARDYQYVYYEFNSGDSIKNSSFSILLGVVLSPGKSVPKR